MRLFGSCLADFRARKAFAVSEISSRYCPAVHSSTRLDAHEKNITPPRSFLAFCLLALTALLAASCGSNEDGSTSDDPDTPFEASETREGSQSAPFADQNPDSENTDTSPVFAGNTTPGDNPISISLGESHSCALREGGTVYCWGENYGQLGNGTRENSSVPVEVLGITDATAISLGRAHSCALHQTGTISCWGDNSGNGVSKLGDGTEEDSAVPVKVLGITDATAITTGNVKSDYTDHSCALHQTGAISCWGSNSSGQLGNGTKDKYVVPVQVTGITDATAIITDDDYSCALHQNGTISCWGDNRYGRLGNGSDADSLVPVKVFGITDATAISLGDEYSCALHQTGTISCWGNNGDGQLGNSTDNDSLVPVQVVGIADATAITTGDRHSCALHQNGAISCWGSNSWGRLGNSTDNDSLVPVQVAGITDATAITTGRTYSCALHQNGNISCWGNNSQGQLGKGTFSTPSSAVPVQVAGITDATAIITSEYHSCALHQTGTISCWGDNSQGQLGKGTFSTRSSAVPVQVANVADATAITTGGSWDRDRPAGHSCALHQTGTISCWGNNWSGQLGNGQSGREASSSIPVQVEGIPVQVEGITDATAITTGEYHSCALHEDGTISCWGSNGWGQLGNRRGRDFSVPGKLASIADATAITTGSGHSCALHQTGAISCWGSNGWGQLGNGQSGEYAMSTVPVEVLGITDATAITTGGSWDRDRHAGHSCALHQTGTISCWGNNWSGQLGNGQSGREASSSIPVQVANIADATAITTGSAYSCALHQNGTISCWGNNRYGQLGNETEDSSSVPVQVANIADATAITTSSEHSCALHQTGTISCWGNNEYGQLGDRTVGSSSSLPVQVEGIADATAITAGGAHSCALHQNGTISCWGNNWSGQLGSNNGWIPQYVVGFEG